MLPLEKLKFCAKNIVGKVMDRKKKILVIITSILLGLTLIFIWGNSCLSKAESTQQSTGVYNLVKPILDAIFGKDVITKNIFRKIAHATEFCLLGLEIVILYFLIHGINVKKLSEIISSGLFVAVIDESIQILSNRGPMISDVLIDFSGYVFGLIIFYLTAFIIYKIMTSKKKKTCK